MTGNKEEGAREGAISSRDRWIRQAPVTGFLPLSFSLSRTSGQNGKRKDTRLGWMDCTDAVGQHGVPRSKQAEKSQEARQQELEKIEKYQDLERQVRRKVCAFENKNNEQKLTTK